MQTIELETNITQDGNIHLPMQYQTLYGSHARIIMLITNQSKSSVGDFLKLRGTLHDNTDFDKAIEQFNQAWQTWKPSV